MKKYKIRKGSLADKIRFIWCSRYEIMEVLELLLWVYTLYIMGVLLCQCIE